MGQRVLSTEEAKSAITRIQGILDGGLSEQVQQLKTQGQILVDPNVWDGPLANDFHGLWTTCSGSLDKTLMSLKELQSKLQRINNDIMAAGGNA